MRILQVIPYFYPAEAYGGPVPAVRELSRELARRGHEVIVYTTDAMDRSTRQKARRLEIEGVKVYYFRNLSNSLAWRRLFFSPGMIPQLRKEVGTFDIIHLEAYRTFQNIAVHSYARKHNIPYVLQARGELVTFFHRGKLKRFFDATWGNRILKDASKLIAVTLLEAEQYKSMGITEDKIEIVPNGVNLSEFDNLPRRGAFRRKHNLKNNQKVILYLGRIYWIKGLDLLANAFADISKDFSQVKLVIAGPDDGYLPRLKKRIKELRIEEKVLFTGPLYGRDKLEAYVDADVYVLPSSYEIFGITVLEACACGTPVITTDRCGMADVIDGKAGLAVPYDKERLEQALEHLLSDDKMRLKFGEYGKNLVRGRFEWGVIAEQIESIYLACLSQRRSTTVEI